MVDEINNSNTISVPQQDSQSLRSQSSVSVVTTQSEQSFSLNAQEPQGKEKSNKPLIGVGLIIIILVAVFLIFSYIQQPIVMTANNIVNYTNQDTNTPSVAGVGVNSQGAGEINSKDVNSASPPTNNNTSNNSNPANSSTTMGTTANDVPVPLNGSSVIGDTNNVSKGKRQKFIWVADGNGSLLKFDSGGNKLGDYNFEKEFYGVAVDLNGNIWLTCFMSDSVKEVNPDGNIIGEYTVGEGPHGIAIDSNSNIWVANMKSDSVTKLDGADGHVLGTFSVPSGVNTIAVDTNGNAWVTGGYTMSGTKTTVVTKLRPDGAVAGTYSVGNRPAGIATDASSIWVALAEDDAVARLRLSDGTQIDKYPVGDFPNGISIDGNGNAWVTNTTSGTVSKLSALGVLLGTFVVGKSPYGVAIDFNGNVWVVNSGDGSVSMINPDGEVLDTLQAGGSQAYPYSLGDMTGFALQNFVIGASTSANGIS